MPTVIGIALKTAHGAPLNEVSRARVSTSSGLEGDINTGGKTGKRQIVVTSFDQWTEVGKEQQISATNFHWTLRRGNLCVRSIRFRPSDIGKILCIGKHVMLEITGEAKPCHVMDEALPGLQAALARDMRAGVTCRVLVGGVINVTDTVNITKKEEV